MSTAAEGRGLRAGVHAVLAPGLIGPIAARLWQTARAGFGVMPAIGATDPGLDAFVALSALLGFGVGRMLALVAGLGATGLSALLALGALPALHARLTRGRAAHWPTPFLATPHAALAIGLAFVLAPSGWIARAIAPDVLR